MFIFDGIFMQDYFNYLNRYYQKIFVLTVAAAEDRRKLFATRFEGLNYQFFYGADKNAFTIDELEEKKIFSEALTRSHHRYNKTMRPGEVACAWSHRMMYEEIIRHNYERVLIFEDDAVPDPEQIRMIPSILDEVPADCELLMWGWAKNSNSGVKEKIKQLWYHFQHRAGFLKWNHQVIRHLYATPYSTHIRRAGFHEYTYAYSISRPGADKLLAMQTPIQYIADNLLGFASVLSVVKSYIVYPAVFLHDNLPDGTHRDSYIR